jgi:hypothetical protein
VRMETASWRRTSLQEEGNEWGKILLSYFLAVSQRLSVCLHSVQ